MEETDTPKISVLVCVIEQLKIFDYTGIGFIFCGSDLGSKYIIQDFEVRLYDSAKRTVYPFPKKFCSGDTKGFLIYAMNDDTIYRYGEGYISLLIHHKNNMTTVRDIPFHFKIYIYKKIIHFYEFEFEELKGERKITFGHKIVDIFDLGVVE